MWSVQNVGVILNGRARTITEGKRRKQFSYTSSLCTIVRILRDHSQKQREWQYTAG